MLAPERNPARLVGYACACAQRLHERERRGALSLLECPACAASYELPVIV